MTQAEEIKAFVGHRVHLVRSREVPRLFSWLDQDLRSARVLDVAGGDGYWAGLLRKRGAHVVSLDMATHKLASGRRLRGAPSLVDGDALALPFPDDCFDAVMSVCALEHFFDHIQAITEMARVLRPGATLVMSVDTLTDGDRYPELLAHHMERYHVQQTFTRDAITADLMSVGFEVDRATYMLRGVNQRLYLAGSRLKPKWSWNALAVLAPIAAAIDRFTADDNGALLLIRATKKK
jgi:SAM-dependent methyltransferase